jgi:hypothetical protein
MAARGSFQKRQKESARKEKRQQKLDRRQGKIIPQARPDSGSTEDSDVGVAEESGTNPETNLPLPVGSSSEPAPVHGQENE